MTSGLAGVRPWRGAHRAQTGFPFEFSAVLLSLFVFIVFIIALFPVSAKASQARSNASSPQRRSPLPAGAGQVELQAKQQRKQGNVFYADGDVEIRYNGIVMRADHVEYNSTSSQVTARDHVRFDYQTQHLSADSANYNVRTGVGRFTHVSGEIRVERKPNPAVLVTPNPLTFEADSVERTAEGSYLIYHARVTVCDPQHPIWTFNAAEAKLRIDRKVILLNANFRILHIPLFYTPYATVPAERNLRQSGLLMPELGNSSIKGYVFGDAYYWAPSSWADATIGAQWLSRRGSIQTGALRLRPWENVSLSANYFGVVDSQHQGGHRLNVTFDAQFDNGWHASADVNQLTSLLFQEVFSPTYAEAINSEVNTTAFLTKSLDGFSLNFAANNYKDFLTAVPETAITLRTAPEVRLGSVDQAPWKRWPFYFGFDSFTDAVHRSDPEINTPGFVDRSEIAPRVTVPLHWGPWLGITPEYTLRETLYGAQQVGTSVVENSLHRQTGEFSLDLRPPSLSRVWERPGSKWKHTIEPDIVYRYVTGVNDFARFIRVDEEDTITDTNEIEYSLTQRLFRRKKSGSASELASWTLLQKYYFDPTFGGALVPATRNVFQALDSVTPFAFADTPRRFSPLVSDFKISPGGFYDAEFRTDYDPRLHRITTAETLVKMHPYGNFQVTLAHYSIDTGLAQLNAIQAASTLQPISNQIRAIVGYSDLSRRGWNASAGFSYDVRNGIAQNELAQVGYNGSCCGLAFGYQRLALGTIRTENQFRVSLIIANIGRFGTLRGQEKIF